MYKNESQEKIIHEINGQMLVIACPGSGKTTTILRRIRHMVEEGINEEKILMITFTKAAADEMKERYKRSYGEATKVTFCTIHSLCLAILCKFTGYTKGSVVSNPSELLYEILINERSINDKKKFVQDALMDISVIKNSGKTLSEYQPKCCEDKNVFLKLYHAYEDRKKELGQVDFDDILLLTLELLQNDKRVLSWIRQKYEYIHVDEYQDVNLVQRDIIYLMAGENGNLAVVGDDDQSIYAFRGASPEIMLNFPKDYPSCKQIYMTTNYRSDRNIVEHAKQLIGNNTERFPKEFLCQNDRIGKVDIKNYKNKRDQIMRLGAAIQTMIRSGADANQIAVLYRTNAEADSVVSVLQDLKIPFYSNDRLESRYCYWIFQDILSYHKTAIHKASKLDIQRTILHPNRYFQGIDISAYGYDPKRIYMRLRDPNAEEWKNRKLKERINEYNALLWVLASSSPIKTMQHMKDLGNYGEYMKSYAKYRNEDVADYDGLWDQYIADIEKHKITTFEEWERYIKKYERMLKEIQAKREGVCLSTMHKSKGLEWEHVFIIDCVEGTTPYFREGEKPNMEDERRLFYVAMTRAKHSLSLYTYKDASKNVVPSRFLKEIGEEA